MQISGGYRRGVKYVASRVLSFDPKTAKPTDWSESPNEGSLCSAFFVTIVHYIVLYPWNSKRPIAGGNTTSPTAPFILNILFFFCCTTSGDDLFFFK